MASLYRSACECGIAVSFSTCVILLGRFCFQPLERPLETLRCLARLVCACQMLTDLFVCMRVYSHRKSVKNCLCLRARSEYVSACELSSEICTPEIRTHVLVFQNSVHISLWTLDRDSHACCGSIRKSSACACMWTLYGNLKFAHVCVCAYDGYVDICVYCRTWDINLQMQFSPHFYVQEIDLTL